MAKRGSPSLKHLSLTAVRAALAKSMSREHAQLTKRLADLEARMRAEGVPVRRQPAGMPRKLRNGLGNAISLHAALENVMRGKVMTPREATEAVERLGYRSGAKSLRYLVCHRLATLPQFERVERGKYRLAR